MTDITERLRATIPMVNDPVSLKPKLVNPDGPAAADEIERLRAALREIADYTPQFDYAGSRNGKMDITLPGSPYDCGRKKEANLLSNIARTALRGQG